MKSFTFDALKKARKKAFKAPTSAETKFMRSLKKVARTSGHIVGIHIDGVTIRNEAEMTRHLKEYSRLIEPWAKRQSAKMLEQVSNANARAYKNSSKEIGALLRSNVAEREVGSVAEALMNEQVALIKSIPIEAGLRAQKLSMEAVYNGSRADQIAQELMDTTGVTESRAQLIAVTETARANASITEARAKAVGARGYIWRTTMDGAERHSHGEMNGKYVEYAKPPTLSDGTTGHAGTFPRCRCYQEPVFDDE